MRRVSAFVILALAVSTVTTRTAQAAPTIEVDPAAAAVGTIVEVKGAGFAAGEIGIHVGEIDPQDALALGPVERDGTFTIRFEVPNLKLGAHLVLACRDVQRSGECRELAEKPLQVIVAPTTTTTTTTTATTL